MKFSRRVFFFLLLTLLIAIFITPLHAQDDAPYMDSSLPVEERVNDLLARMSLEEKIGQMTLVEKNSISPDAVGEFYIGGVLSGGGGYPNPNTPEDWLDMVNAYQEGALSTPLGIPMIYGVDAVHGHNNVYGATIFPHNIGLGATRNPELMEQIGRATALEMIATGIYWDYAPVVAAPQDYRWGRTYEGFSENTAVVTDLSIAFMNGLQQGDLSAPLSVLATPKHFIGDGGTTFGTSGFGPSNIDRGDMQVDEATMRELYLPPYTAAVNAGAMSIMASYSSWNGTPMHAESYLLTDVLKGELGFQGFIVSDWAGIDAITSNYYDAVVSSINSGVDMNMVPQQYDRFIQTMFDAVANGDITEERIDDAVTRILRTKFEMGLFEHPFGDESLLETVGSPEHRAIAQQAVSESLVLLKNNDAALPIATDTQTIFVAGSSADNIGIQSGGWTIEWQGQQGNITDGTTILEAIEATVSADTRVEYSRSAQFDEVVDDSGNPIIADVGIAIVGELPYAEFEGDSATLTLTPADLSTIERMREHSQKLVIVLLSGRPLVITDQLNISDAFVAAWLPGTEGQGVADVLFGNLPFTGRLPFTWLRNIDQLPFDFANLPTDTCDAPLFPFDYGLTTDDTSSVWVDLALECSPVTASAEPNEAAVAENGLLAPEGDAGETYYAPFPLDIDVNGWFNDWEGVPTVTVSSADGSTSVTFAAAADEEYLYLTANIVDSNIISGTHGADYWNEDSVEFYINGTGNPDLTAYEAGVVQMTIPPLNADHPAAEAIIGGVQGSTAGAQVVTVNTSTGYAVEMAVPLHNDIWDIVPENNGSIGFQVHLNGASTDARDTKLIWSIYDTADQSYMNPSVFGSLIFYQVGEESASVSADADSEATTEAASDTSSDTTSSNTTLELVWSDEFEGEAGTPINPDNWTAEIGGHGWGNNELEYYTDRPENASLDGNGNLAIVARRENPADYSCHYGTCQYTSARLLTRDHFEFTYGRVEARLRIPYGQGVWPAFWMLGANIGSAGWPNSGEIDIMENVGHEMNTVHGTIHGPGYSGANGRGAAYPSETPFSDDFHVYAVEWTETEIRWYVDGNLYNTITQEDLGTRRWVFDHDFFILLNVAVGGLWPGLPDDTTVFPQTMLVDYVRVYQFVEQ
jgi:beta-glucosidase